VLAALEEPRGDWQRSLAGAVLLEHRAWLQTVTSGVALDVAWCRPAVMEASSDAAAGTGLDVVRLGTMGRRRLALARPRARVFVAAGAGAFERWGLRPGDRLEIKGA